MLKNKLFFSGLVLIAGGLTSTGASATWSHYGDTCYSNCTSDGNYYEYKYDTVDTSKTVKVTAWSNTNTGGKLRNVESYYDTKGYGADNNVSTDDGYDANKYLDNKNYIDSVLFDYGDKCVVLDSITLGGYSNDADVEIMAYVGDKTGDAFKTYLSGKTYAELQSDKNADGSDAWKTYVVNDVKTGNSTSGYTKTFGKDQFGNDDYTASSYWLVKAGNAGDGKDYVKVKNMGGHDYDGTGCKKVEVKCDTPTPPTSVPEPGVLGLLAIGLIGLGVRRRKVA